MKTTVSKYMIIAAVSMFGCTNNLLEKTPLDQLSTETFYTNEMEALMGLTGVYSAITPSHNSLPWYQFEFMSDNTSSMDWTGSQAFSSWNQTPSTVTAVEKWKKSYQIIGRANAFLQNVETVSMDETRKTQLKAEARFLRGYAYSDLIFLYGDVPLVMDVLSLEDAKVSRAPKEQVLAVVLDDFDFASHNLPLTYQGNDVGRATKGAALALKARTLLYNEQWSEAAAAAKEVIDLGVYELFPDYEALFEEANENNSEVIFDIQYIPNLSPQPWPSASLVYTSWPCGCPTLSMIDAYCMKNGLPISDPESGYKEQDPFTDRDPRMEASIGLPGHMYGSSVLIPATLAKAEGVTGLKIKKYADLSNPDKENSSINTIVIRYGEILLIRAEALIESGTLTQEVYDLIDAIRERADMPSIATVEGTGLNQEQLRDILRQERRVELFGEGNRYFDLMRWKLSTAFHDTYGYNLDKLSDPADPSKWVFERVKVMSRSYADKGWLWPIPLEDIQNNANLTQNPGY